MSERWQQTVCAVSVGSADEALQPAVSVSGLICDPAGLTPSGFSDVRQMRAGGLSVQLHVKA